MGFLGQSSRFEVTVLIKLVTMLTSFYQQAGSCLRVGAPYFSWCWENPYYYIHIYSYKLYTNIWYLLFPL
jgi:hypothetical protein